MSSKNKSIRLFFAAAVFFSGSCSAPVPEQHANKKIRFSATPLFTIAPEHPVSSVQQFYQPSGSDKVYLLDPSDNAWQVLDTRAGSVRFTGMLPDLTAEFESVFTVDEQRKRIHIFYPDSLAEYTFRGDRLSGYRIPECGGFTYPPNNYFCPVIRKNKLYIAYFRRTEGAFRKPEFFQGAVEAEIDRTTGNYLLLPQGYPAAYRKNCYSYTYHPQRLVISAAVHGYLFPNSDSIYLCNIRTGKQTAKFFGAKKHPVFQHITFDKIPTLNESVFDELAKKNPQYSAVISAPLAGYYLRQLWIKEGEEIVLRTAVFDRNFNYVGETDDNPGWIIDSRKGLLAMTIDEKNRIVLQKLAW